MIAITINARSLMQAFRKLNSLADDKSGLLMVMGREARNQLVRHYRDKDRSEPNKLGGRRTHYWLQVARSVQAPAGRGPDKVVVAINEPTIRQKIYGGKLTPGKSISRKTGKPTKALTIPVSQEAYGRTASTLEYEEGIHLFLVPRDFGTGLLAAAMKDGSIKVHYVLKKTVQQKPDPTALPDMESGSPFAMAIRARAEGYVRRKLALPGNEQTA